MLRKDQLEKYLEKVITPKLEDQEKTGGYNQFFGTTPLELVRDVVEYILEGDPDDDPLE